MLHFDGYPLEKQISDVTKDILKKYVGVTKAKGKYIVDFSEVTKHNRCRTSMKVYGNKVLTHLDTFIKSIGCFFASLDI